MITEHEWNTALSSPDARQLALRARQLLQQRGLLQPAAGHTLSEVLAWALETALAGRPVSTAAYYAAQHLVLNPWLLERQAEGEAPPNPLLPGEKDWQAFRSGSGPCYSAADGSVYTRADFLALVFDAELAARLLALLDDQSPATLLAEELDHPVLFGTSTPEVAEQEVFQVEDWWRALLWNGLEPEAPLERLAEELLEALAAAWPCPLEGSAAERARAFLVRWLDHLDGGFWATCGLELQVSTILCWTLRMVRPELVR